jgi:hypothetical protein
MGGGMRNRRNKDPKYFHNKFTFATIWVARAPYEMTKIEKYPSVA